MLTIKKIVNHKFFFNFVVILSFVHNIMFIADGSYNCVFIFSALTFIFNYFLNKPKISLLCAIVSTNIFFGCKKIKEGLKNKDKKDKKDKDEDNDDENHEDNDDENHEDNDDENHEGNDDEELLEKVKKIKENIIEDNKMKKNKENDDEDNKMKKNKENQKKRIEGLLNKFDILKNDKDSIINPKALSVFMNLNKKVSNANSDGEFHNLKNLLKNNKQTMKNLIDAF